MHDQYVVQYANSPMKCGDSSHYPMLGGINVDSQHATPGLFITKRRSALKEESNTTRKYYE
eukprot:COSAG02_NODE_6191_length_3741_cov_8.726249_2_plen_61_part_00